MATIVTHLGDITGAVGPFQIQGTVRRHPETRMLRRRQPAGGAPSAAQLAVRHRFAQATDTVRRWTDHVDPGLFGTFPLAQHGPNTLRSYALRELAYLWWGWVTVPSGTNLFPPWPHKQIHSPGGPSTIRFRGTQLWVDPLITDASLTLVGFKWTNPPYDPPVTFAFTWPFIAPTWDHTENIGYAYYYSPAAFVFTGKKCGRWLSSCLDYTIVRSDS